MSQDTHECDGLTLPLTVAAGRISSWICSCGGLPSPENVGPWSLQYELCQASAINEVNDCSQQALLAITLRRGSRSFRVLVVVFRVAANSHDWLHTIACMPDETLTTLGIGIHSGFGNLAMSGLVQHSTTFLECVKSEAQKGTSLILLCGHSLGGAVANITHLMMHIACKYPSSLSCSRYAESVHALPDCALTLMSSVRAITFGAPMTLTSCDESNAVEEYLREHAINYVLNNDFLPRLPGQVDYLKQYGVCKKLLSFVSSFQPWCVDLSRILDLLTAEVSWLTKYRHIGRVIILRGRLMIQCRTEGSIDEALRSKGPLTEATFKKNWWSEGAYDACLDHQLERYSRAISSAVTMMQTEKHLFDVVHMLTFGNNPSIMDLGMAYLKDNRVSILAEALTMNFSLVALNLCNNMIKGKGAAALSMALKTNTALTMLDLRGNMIGNLGTISLSETLKLNSSLAWLALAGNNIGDAGGAILADAIKVNEGLFFLDLDSNGIGDQGVTQLAKALRMNDNLTALSLRWNNIQHHGAAHVSEALKVNEMLATLDLGRNHVGDIGARSLSNALLTNEHLSRLDLAGNGIGDSGVSAIAESLDRNDTLLSLDLLGNDFGDIGALSLSTALRLNRGLSYLDLRNTSITNNGVETLMKAKQIKETFINLEVGVVTRKSLTHTDEMILEKSLASFALQQSKITALAVVEALLQTLKANKAYQFRHQFEHL